MIWLLALFVVVQVGDGVSTWLALRSSAGREGNPAASWLINRIGLVPSILILKSVAIALGVAATGVPGGGYFLAVLIALFAWVVWHNLSIVFRSAP